MGVENEIANSYVQYAAERKGKNVATQQTGVKPWTARNRTDITQLLD